MKHASQVGSGVRVRVRAVIMLGIVGRLDEALVGEEEEAEEGGVGGAEGGGDGDIGDGDGHLSARGEAELLEEDGRPGVGGDLEVLDLRQGRRDRSENDEKEREKMNP